MTIDGSTGAIYQGQMPLVAAKIGKELEVFLSWADATREGSARGSIKGFNVRTNADTPADAKRAFDFGAQGIGLCRTEHMFFDKEKLIHFRAMIVAENEKDRKDALKKILPLQKKDFIGIFKAMGGKPVTIRLLDPPLHEFVPHTKAETEELAKFMGVKAKDLQPKIDSLHESNPMLGHRGCRLAITYPEIYDTQVEAIMLAAVECAKKKIPVAPEIMIPLICDPKELSILQARTQKIVEAALTKAGIKMKVLIGTMIEVQLWHQRPDPDDLRVQPRRRRFLPAPVHRPGNPSVQSYRDDRRGRSRIPDEARLRVRPQDQAGPEARHLRRAGR
jgi:pyruvate,orthophosphate dikinase